MASKEEYIKNLVHPRTITSIATSFHSLDDDKKIKEAFDAIKDVIYSLMSSAPRPEKIREIYKLLEYDGVQRLISFMAQNNIVFQQIIKID